MTRRGFLRGIVRWGGILIAAVPFVAFVTSRRNRPPREVRIQKEIRPGGHVVESDFVLFETGSGPLAVSRRCTHLGCTLQYRDAEKAFLCPCHGSRFAWDGKYLAGPAKKDLVCYEVKALADSGGFVVLVPRGGP
ncbi:MAG: Rieske 2Fe-2S domain-containing protein [Deltaproteobacteria bacterium]